MDGDSVRQGLRCGPRRCSPNGWKSPSSRQEQRGSHSLAMRGQSRRRVLLFEIRSPQLLSSVKPAGLAPISRHGEKASEIMPASDKEEAAPVSEATGAPEKREERKRKRRSGWEEQPAATPALPAPLAAAPDPPTAQAGLGLTPIQQEAIRAAQAMQAQAMQSGAPGDVFFMHAVAGSPPGQPPFVCVRKALRACWKSRSEVALVFALTCLYAQTHAAGRRESRGRGATVRGVAAL